MDSFQRLGDFEILREIGRGGMGVVYEARQVSLNRRVALKVLGGGLALSGKGVQRFHREAEAAAKLHHTNIVPVYATGDQDGTHFYAMELIAGPSLDRVIKQLCNTSLSGGRKPPESFESSGGLRPPLSGPEVETTGPYVESPPSTDDDSSPLTSSSLSSDGHYFDTVARMIADVADALEYAHKQGIIHRDIKPSNLLLSSNDRLSINDFGLARMLEHPGMTVTGEFVGTPAYMSPEQITAGRAPLDHRTDIYSLGATLYELLTFQRPFTGERRDQVIAQIIHKEPKQPRKVNKKVPVDLETICLKAMEKDPDRRYQTAGAMAEDLRRHVNRFAISARRVGPVGRTIKWARRRPAVAASLGLAVVLGFVALGFAYQARVSEKGRLAERRQRAIDDALLLALTGDFDKAQTAIEEAELLGASPGQLRILRGQLALYQGGGEEARRQLQQAVKLMPESVAAHALLVMAILETGSGEQSHFDRALERVEQLTPSTPEDFLFRARVESIWGDPEAAIKTVHEAIRRRDSPIARVVQAEVQYLRAVDTCDPRDARLSLENAIVVKSLLRENAYAVATSLWTQLFAANIYEKAGMEQARQAALRQAERDANALKRFPLGGYMTLMPQAEYLEYVGNPKAALEFWRCATEENVGDLALPPYSQGLYRRGQFALAFDVIGKGGWNKNIADAVWRAYVAAELPDGPARALQAYRAAVSGHELRGYMGLLPQTILRLLGRKSEAIAASLEIPDESFHPERRNGWDRRIWEYNCDLISAEELSQASIGSQLKQCEGNFFIAMTMLADGDRIRAREHFQRSVATRVFAYMEYHFSRCLLARMDQDPNWPPWIPVRE